MSSLGLLSEENQKRLAKIKFLILDIDGVLTDGQIFWVEGQGWTRKFHIQDGYGIRLIMRHGIQVAIFSGSNTKDIQERIKVLGIQHAYLGNEDKIKSLEDLVQKTGCTPQEMIFIGDELFDLPVLEKVGFSVTVPHAPAAVKKRVHYITQAQGGWGAVREVIEALREVQHLGPYLD